MHVRGAFFETLEILALYPPLLCLYHLLTVIQPAL